MVRGLVGVLVVGLLTGCGTGDDVVRGGARLADEAARGAPVADDSTRSFAELMRRSDEEVVLTDDLVGRIASESNAAKSTVREAAATLPAETRVRNVIERRIENLRARFGQLDEQTDGEVRQVVVGSACDALELGYTPTEAELEGILWENIASTSLQVPAVAARTMLEELVGLYDDLAAERSAGGMVEVIALFTACQVAG